MENDNIKEASGFIEEAAEKNNRHTFKINKKTYSFFETKQDGNPTKAWQQWQELSLKSGQYVIVAYKDTTKGKYTYHNALSFKIPTQEEQKKAVKQESKPTNSETDWDAIAEGKVRHGVVCSMIEAGKEYEDIKKEMPKFVEMIMDKKSTAAQKMKKGMEEDEEEEINTDEIPF